MNYSEFESIMSLKRMRRYLNACGGDTRKAMTLYRYNLRVSQEMFAIISCYEVALRNAIDKLLTNLFGEDWLRNTILKGGVFDNPKLKGTARIIRKVYGELIEKGKYSPSKMLSSMEFGVWKYKFSMNWMRLIVLGTESLIMNRCVLFKGPILFPRLFFRVATVE